MYLTISLNNLALSARVVLLKWPNPPSPPAVTEWCFAKQTTSRWTNKHTDNPPPPTLSCSAVGAVFTVAQHTFVWVCVHKCACVCVWWWLGIHGGAVRYSDCLNKQTASSTMQPNSWKQRLLNQTPALCAIVSMGGWLTDRSLIHSHSQEA